MTGLAVVDYGAGNLRSVEHALEAARIPHHRAGTPADLAGAAGIVLPGVGAAASAVRELRRRGLADALREATVPLLGVCLGMQLLTARSEEGGAEVACLGLVEGRTRRFPEGVRLPHVGWSRVALSPDSLFDGLGEAEWFYFLHSYRVECAEGRVVARASHGTPFPAAVRHGRACGVQFHPEKSGPAGRRVLLNFWRACGGDDEAGPC